jgi:CheY-like chemotaxis protein
VTAQSEGENRGAIFTVLLPLIEQTDSITFPEPMLSCIDSEKPLSNLQILMVDDENDTREFQAFVLEQSGARLITVASGLEALQVLDQCVPDILVSDIGMPGMDGYELIQQIRSRTPDRGGRISAIALTAYAGELNQRKAIESGFQAHLSKPVEPEQLIGAIVSLVGSLP